MTLDIFAEIRPQPWMKEGACRDYFDPDMWFDGNEYLPAHHYSPTTLHAIAICNTCPVQAECAQYALDNEEIYGVFGGLTGNQRRVILNRKLRLA